MPQYNSTAPIMQAGAAADQQLDISGNTRTTLSPSVNGGLTLAHFVAANTNNATALKASAGQVYVISGYNAKASAIYLKFYDKATAPSPGSDTPVWVVGFAASSPISFHAPQGLKFSTGIAYALVTGIGDTDNTAVASSDATINIGYA